MNNKVKKILSSILAVTLAIATMFTTSIVVNATELTNVEKTTDAEGNTIVKQTENPTEYTTVADKVEEALPEVSAEPILNVNSVEEIKTTEPEVTNPESLFSSCRLIITSAENMEFKEGSIGVDNIKSVTRFDDKYIVEFRSCDATEKAYNFYTGLGYEVEIDIVQDKPEGVNNKDVRDNEVGKEEIASTDEVKPTQPIEQINQTEEQNTIIVAIFDTGLNDGEEIFNDKVVQGKNFVDENDTEVKDVDTHGTTMSRIVLESVADENTNNNIKVMPIKVLNDEGKGTTLTAYKGIKYVIEKKQQNPSLDFVINLSMSGIGHSKLLESAINEAYNNNIPVVVAAGNDNTEITNYTPANVDSAFTIGSADKNVINEEEIEYTKANYSNFGSDTNNIDYVTNGHYEYVRYINDKEVITKIDGTSVSSAYVAGYVSMLKQMSLSDDNSDNDNMSIADIDASLLASSITTNDLTLGNGYLAKENIHLKKVEEKEQEVLPIEEIRSEALDEGIELNKNANTALSSHTRWGNYFAFANYYQSCGFPCKIIRADNNDWAPLDLASSLSDANPMAIWVVGGVTFSGNLTVNGQKVIACEMGGLVDSPLGLEQDDAIGAAITINGGSRLILEGGEVNARYRGLGRPAIENNGTLESYNCHFVCVHNNDTIISNNGTMVLNDSLVTPDISLGGHTTNAITNNSTLTVNNSGIYNDNGLWTGGITNTTWSNCTINNNSEVSGDTYGVNNNTRGAITIDNSHIWGGVAVSNVAAWNELKINNSDIDGRDTGLKNEAGHPVRLNGTNYIHGNNFGLHQRSGIVYIQNHGNRFSTNNCKSFLQSAARCEGGTISITGGDFFDAAIALWVEGGSVSLSGGQYRNSNIGIYKNGGAINSTKSALIHDNVTGFRLDGENQAVTINNTSIYNNIVGVSNTGTNGTVNVNGANIYSNWVGINHDANESKPTSTTNFNSGNIYSNPVVCGINAGKGRVNVNGGSIYSNPTGIENSATLNIKGGSISSNTGFGVNNTGTVTQTGGSIYSNKGATPEGANGGVLQNGTYNVGAGANIDSFTNSVYLKSGKVLNVNSAFNSNNTSSIKLTTDTNDRKVGRKLVTGNQNLLNSYNSEHTSGRFLLAFDNPANDSYDGDDDFDGIANTAAVRVGNGTNITKGNMCLSAMYAVSYNGLQDFNQRKISYNPNQNSFYWLEKVDEIGLTGTSKVVYINEDYSETDLSETGTGEYEFVGWCEDSNGNGAIYTQIRQEWLDRNKPYYAIYRRGKAKVTYNPNGAVDKEGKAYEPFEEDEQTRLREDYTPKDGSIFGEKQTKDGYIERQQQVNDFVTNHIYYITKKGEVVNTKGSDTDMYSFQGWSVLDYAQKSKAEQIIYNGITTFYNLYFDENGAMQLNYLTQPRGMQLATIVTNIVKHRNNNIEALNNGQLGSLNAFLEVTGIVNVYAVWDKYPTIETRTFTISSRDAENLTDELLLDKIKVTDEEDGAISKDKIKLIYDKDQIVGLAEQGTCYTSITVVAEDSVGNVTKKVIMIGVNQVNPLSRNEQGFIRFISREAFEKSEADGGPLENSIWRTDEEYRKTMLENFDNLENNTPEQRWNFTHEQVLEVQDYIKTNGFGKTKSDDSLRNFYDKFESEGCLTENRLGI